MPEFVTFTNAQGEHLALVLKTNEETDPKDNSKYKTYDLFVFDLGTTLKNQSAHYVAFEVDKVNASGVSEETTPNNPPFPPF